MSNIRLTPLPPRRGIDIGVDEFTRPDPHDDTDEGAYIDGEDEEGRRLPNAERRLAFNSHHPSSLRSRLFDNMSPGPDNVDTPNSLLKRTLYDLFEDPTSSTAAFTVHVFSTFLIVLSAIITILETLPPFHSTPSLVWFGLETSFVFSFTVEYICRAYAHSETWLVLWNWMISFFSVIDLLAILPYYIEIALRADTTEFFRFSILRTSRLLRVFRPFRYSNTILLTIEVMYLSMKRSKDALLALGFFVLMTLIVFSTLLYFAERGTWDASLNTFVDSDGNPTMFESIPGAAWFVLVTITTVGYGEVIPRTILGRLFTVPLLLVGLLLIALPSFVLGREFAAIWEAMVAQGGTVSNQRANSLMEFIDSHVPRHENVASSSSSVRDPESCSGSLEDPPTTNPAESSSRSRLQISPKQSRHTPHGAPQHAFHSTIVESPTQLSNREHHLSSSYPQRHLTNRKLARNQQALSRQIEEVSTTLREMKEQLAALQMQIRNKG